MNSKKRLLLIVTIVFVMLTSIFSGCSLKNADKGKEASKKTSQQQKAPEAKKYGNIKGCIWEIKSDKAKVYLFGSIHIAKKDMYPFDKTVEDAFHNSKNLAVEVDVSDTSKVMNSQSKLIYPANDDVYNHISKEGKEKLDAYAKELGINMNVYKKMKLWVVESAFQQMQLQKFGYSSSDGVDMYFLKAAKGKKKILELESMDFQVDLLNGMSDQVQEGMFFEDIKNSKENETEFSKLYEAYKAADERELVKQLIEPSKQDAVYYKKMLIDRNVGMADKIDGYLKTNDSYFVVAGLAHFIGDDSVVKLLEKKGYTVTRK